jgi:Tfp pilus assembly protein PilF
MFVLRLKIIGRLVISVALLMMVSSCSTEPKSRSQVTPIPQNSSNTQQQKRIALVIGNANYQVGKLDTPLNDATDMEAALNELGFEVILLKDSSKRQMDDALDQFSTRINQGYVGLFYYAGHGMQVEGENYLIPVNVQIKAEKDVEYESMPLGKILGRMESAGNQINIVILDACRDNPFRKFSRSSSRGLTTPVQPASGTLIVFATAPGKVASDGMGRNGLFTSYLLKYIKTPNLDVDLMLRQVRSNVAKDTKNYQVPWNSSSLTGEFAFNQKPETITSKPSPPTTFSTPQPQPSPSPQLTATAFYDSGNSKRESGDNQGAIADYNQAIKLKPDFAGAYNNRGLSKYYLKDNQGAIADYNQAIKLKSDYANAYYNWGLINKNLGNNQKAISDFRQAAKLYQQQNNQTWYKNSLDRLYTR